jgi:glucosamine 6-phosphate synthetase-like amidotransferase/phosphosugar isomerase protein
MGSATEMDLGGMTLLVKDIKTATGPGQSGTAVNLTGDIQVQAGKTVNLDSTTATGSSHAATVTKYAIKYTTEALTTAAGASQAEVLTLSGVVAGDFVFISRCGGTSSGGTPLFKAVTTTDTVTITIDNKHASAALDGTLIFNVWVLKA